MRAPRYNGYQPASPATSRTKRHVPSRDTKAELALRRALWSMGFRYRVNVRGLPGTPDIVFPRQRLVIFCDGDFFHGRHWRVLHKKLESRANAEYWIRKIEYNRQRDRETNRRLASAGWRILRFWESDIHDNLPRVVRDVRHALQRLEERPS
jgi:DNA mismatch endonuclease, patch repair protein